jgi:hypothetical protein
MNKVPFCLSLLLAALVAGHSIAAPTPTPAELVGDLPPPKNTSLEPRTDIPAEQPVLGASPAPAAADILSPLKVVLTPGQTGPRDIYDELTIFVELANVGTEVITLNYVYLQVGDDVKRTRPEDKPVPTATPLPATAGSGQRERGALNHPEDGIWEGREQHPSIKLNPNGSRTERLVIPRADPSCYFCGLVRNPSLLTFSPREHDIHVMVEYAVGSQDDLSLRSTLKVTFTSTWGSIMLGGCLGVVMLCALRVVVAASRTLKGLYVEPVAGATPVPRQRILDTAKLTVGRELLGSIVWLPSVIIISFLLWRMGPSSFPISFQVNDFAGGVLLGLFTRALVEPLIKKLFPVSDEN